MKQFDIFPIKLAEFCNNDENLNKKVFRNLVNTPFKFNGAFHKNANQQTDHYLHLDKNFSEITAWINVCLEEYRKQLQYDCDKFEISTMWGNCDKASSGTNHPTHYHNSSFISGVYYVTPGSDLYFKDPLIQRLHNSIGLKTPAFDPIVKYKTGPGKLLIFPSYLEHGTDPHLDPWDRWSIAFNVWPTGYINKNVSAGGNPSVNLNIRL